MKPVDTLTLLPLLTCALATPVLAEPTARPVELLVKWREGPTSLEASELNARIGSRVVRNFNAVGWQLVELPPGMTLVLKQAYHDRFFAEM